MKTKGKGKKGKPSGGGEEEDGLVQMLKDMYNCTEEEMHALIEDFNMDTSDAVYLLLSQDPLNQDTAIQVDASMSTSAPASMSTSAPASMSTSAPASMSTSAPASMSTSAPASDFASSTTRTVEGPPRIPCHLCEKDFKTDVACELHQGHVHQNAKKKCKSCWRKFVCNADRDQHYNDH